MAFLLPAVPFTRRGGSGKEIEMYLKGVLIVLLGVFVVLVSHVPSRSQMSNEELLLELKLLKERVQELEQEIRQRSAAGEQKSSHQEFDRIRSEDERVSTELTRLGEENKGMKGILDEISHRVTVNGLVEIEASYSSLERKGDKGDEKTSDITLATAQLEFDAPIHEYVNAHLILLWEEDDTEPLDVDEGTITLGASETFPFYLLAGRFYPSYGEFNTYFISDPLTLEVAETRESAAAVGYVGTWANLSIGGFNGDVSDEEDDRINSWWANAQVYNPEGTLGLFRVKLGASYFSNLADSDMLSERVPDRKLQELVAGFSVFGIGSVGPVSLSAEYVTSLDDFRPGELDFAVLNEEARSAKPSAWNLELAFSFLEKFQVAGKYERSMDLYSLLPQVRYGGVFGWEIFPFTTWSIEYLHGVYDDNDEDLDKEDVVTSQLAVEF
ncbi:MAG: LbtU family siderophore porin [Deltaproteobacteria bacterium]|nr:LbtU family siderophore porin [Deltaproteobacteria bacterium]